MKRQVLKVRKRKLLTINNLMDMFGVSRQTIHTWRLNRELPFIEYPDEKTSFIRFEEHEVIAWARRNKIRRNRKTHRPISTERT